MLGLVYTADGHTLLTGGGDDAVRAWDLTGKRSFLERTRKPGRFGFGWVTPSAGRGGYTAHSDIDFGIRFFDTETGRPTSFTGYPCCWGGAFNPTNTRFVGSYGRTPVGLGPAHRRLVADNEDQPWPRDLGDLTYTNDGEHLIVADGGGYLTLIDAETLAPVGRPVQVGSWLGAPQAGRGQTAFVPVGDDPKTVFDSFEFLVTATEWVEVDLQSGTLERRVQAPIGTWGASISPDRTRLALTGWDGERRAGRSRHRRAGQATRPRSRRPRQLGRLVGRRVTVRSDRGRRDRQPVGRAHAHSYWAASPSPNGPSGLPRSSATATL